MDEKLKATIEELLQKGLAKTQEEAEKKAKELIALEVKEAKDKAEAAEKKAAELEEKLKTADEIAKKQQEHLDALDIRIQKGLKKPENEKSFSEKLYDSLKEKEQALGELKNIKKDGVGFNVKAAATMTLGNYSGGTVGLTQWDPSFTLVPRRNPFLRQLVTVRPVSDKYVAWAEQANRDGGAGNTAEGTAKTQADFDIVEANKQVEKITAFTKVSKEALADIGFLQSEINNDLLSLINLKLDTDLLSGSGSTPVIKGINSYATTFSVASTGLENAIENANEWDVLRAAIWQVRNGYFEPNYIIMNPIDVAKADMLKATTNEYLIHQAAGQYMFKSFYGIPVIENNGMTAGNFLVGDFTKSNLGIREEVNIQIGYDGDDFTKNLITILAEMRAVHYIKSNHTKAFVKGTFSTAKAALETA